MQTSERKDAEQIREQLATVIHAWETGETDLLDSCVSEELKAYTSIHGNCYVRDQLKWQMCDIGKERTTTDIRMVNELSRVNGNQAAQYATIIGLFADKESHLCFGGTFSNKLENQNGVWMFTEIRFELQTDDSVKSYTLGGDGLVSVETGNGDLSFIEHWKKVNTCIGLFVDPVQGQGIHTIMPEFDAPWYLIKKQDVEETDEKKIQNVFLQYCYALDLNTPDLFDGIFSEDVQFVSNQGGILGKKDAVNYLTIIRQASARSFHAVRFESMDITDKDAKVKAIRLSPELAKVTETSDGKVVACVNAGWYELAFVKQDGKWQINRFQYHVN